jgi:hypothetical protein
MFDKNSRYAQLPTYQVPDRRGRQVAVVPPAPALVQALAGYHVRKDGQRLDLLAGRYLDDATMFWRICELADVMLPDALGVADEIAIPQRAGYTRAG